MASVMIQGFYERLNEACRRSWFSKVQIAKICGIDRKCLSNHEHVLSVRHLAKFCAATNTDANWLLGLRRKEEEMKRTTVYCDRCGKEIPGGIVFKVVAEAVSQVDEHILIDHPITEKNDRDYCEDCVKDILHYAGVRHGDNSEKQEEAPAAKKDIEKREDAEKDVMLEEQKRPRYDRGKICALYRANWNCMKIADEMGCTPQTVINILTKEGIYEKGRHKPAKKD